MGRHSTQHNYNNNNNNNNNNNKNNNNYNNIIVIIIIIIIIIMITIRMRSLSNESLLKRAVKLEHMHFKYGILQNSQVASSSI